MSDTAELVALVVAALTEAGRTLDALTITEATDLAAALRAVAALPTPTPRDVRLRRRLEAVATLVEEQAAKG